MAVLRYEPSVRGHVWPCGAARLQDCMESKV
jgi:hypothetical protein